MAPRLRGDGEVVWGGIRVSLIRDSDGLPLYLAGQVTDITEQKLAAETMARYARDLSELAEVDPLTGLASESALRAVLEREVTGSRIGALVVFDLESGSVSDTDFRRVAGLVGEEAPMAEFAGRAGGRSIALVLPGASRPTVEQAACRVLESVSALDLGDPVAIGISSWIDSATDSQELLAAAFAQIADGGVLEARSDLGPACASTPALIARSG